MTDQPDALLACPFCGVKLEEGGDYTSEAAWNWYQHPDGSDCLLNGVSFHDVHSDIEAWNTRPAITSPSLVERLLEIAVDELHYERLDENTERAKQQERDALRPLFIEALAAATAPEDAALVKEALFRIDHHHYVAKVAREYACGDDAEESDRDADLLGRLAAALGAREWQPIETAPKDGTAIWLLLDNQPCIGYCEPSDDILRKTDTWFVKATFRRGDRARGLPDEIFSTYACGVQPEAWMPLPTPPAPGKEGQP